MFISWDGLADAVGPDEIMYLADGSVRLRVSATRPEMGEIDADVEIGGAVASRQGLNIPGPVDRLPAVPQRDLELLRHGESIGVDLVALSFVRRASDVEFVREHTRLPLVAKIEKPQAVQHAEEIVRAADCVMVARGDLGIEMPIEEVPIVQKQVIALAGALARPSITATQMLDSMVPSLAPDARRGRRRRQRDPRRHRRRDALPGERRRPLPGRRDRDDGRDRRAHRGRRALPRVERAARAARPPRPRLHDRLHRLRAAARARASPRSSCPTLSGRSARLISAHRPNVPIYALSPGHETVRRCGLMWGVQAASMRRHEVTEELILDAGRARRRARLVPARRARRDHGRAAVGQARDDEPAPDPPPVSA